MMRLFNKKFKLISQLLSKNMSPPPQGPDGNRRAICRQIYNRWTPSTAILSLKIDIFNTLRETVLK